MNDKLKQIGIPFILMIIFNLGIYYLNGWQNFGEGLSPHVGLLLISGLLFGPYGALGSALGTFLCDLVRGYSLTISVLSEIIGFAISYLAYKLWYGNYKGRLEITRPKLNNTYNIILFIVITLICALLFSVLNGKLFYLFYPDTVPIHFIIETRYFLNFINSAFVFGIIGLWLSNKIDFVHIPKKSDNESKEKVYKILGILLLITMLLAAVPDYGNLLNNYIAAFELIVITAILFAYLTKPITSDIMIKNSKSIPEEIMNIFHLAILFIIIIGILISYDHLLITAIDDFLPINANEIMISMMILVDILLLIFFIPSFSVLKYIEIKVIEPIISFSKIEDFIHENEKIESDKLVGIYSEYVNEETEIGTLARSYTDLINFNNSYIENIHEIEGEKERIKAELNIATRIQAANLPTEAIVNDDYIVNGYSKPAKEVGGDFFDYYPIDEDNLVIVIGDASGKGVPAAILAMITQVMIKQLIKSEVNPSKALYLLNNQLCENNSESMFLTLWLGVYNTATGKLTFSNAGHNPPLIKENDIFEYLNIDSGIVLGIMEDFDYTNEEITLTNELVVYTDGITDANNNDNEMYGENRLLNFFNEFKSDNDPIRPLLNDIHGFTQDAEQFDDMTLLYLKIKED
ncbi:PP2C family protein-serine/threonine phosphatase [Methanobrevibacter sp.]|uniref:PP2C family protein-serine/threonine phosphatase n=1 Tax=Methanobrevibacter sp. TaxID=66852 RepID=UPI0025EE75BC|nr:PP2C family protein-serine/threonine phosphatase [Methanobrevibacter sp.]MBR4448208.1 serine/threonine-protein phosphatase [Methanobrevibacter sp.]